MADPPPGRLCLFREGGQRKIAALGCGPDARQPEGPGVMAAAAEGRCSYFVEKKKRFCKMVVAAGKKFCGEHAGAAEVWYLPTLLRVGTESRVCGGWNPASPGSHRF